MSLPPRYWQLAGTMVGYVAAAKFGLLLAVHQGAVTPIWPPTGIALAALLVWGRGMWPAILAGAVTVNLLNELQHRPLVPAIELSVWIGLGNTLGPVLAAVLLERFDFRRNLERIRDVGLLFVAAIAGAVVSSSSGVSALAAVGNLPSNLMGRVGFTWFTGDALGYVGFAPVLLLGRPDAAAMRRMLLPVVVTVLTACLVGWDPLLFHRQTSTSFLLVVPVLWLGMLAGPRGVAIGYVLIASILVWCSNLGVGPFGAGFYPNALEALSIFLAITSLLALLLAAWAGGWQRTLLAADARALDDARFRLLFEKAADPHLLYDATGIIDCNPAAPALLGLAGKEALLARRPLELSAPQQEDGQTSAAILPMHEAEARRHGNHRFIWLNRRQDGGDLPCEVTLTPVRIAGRDALLAVWHDLCEQRAQEAVLRAAKDAAEAGLRARSEFLSTMSHELRTPLNGVIGMAQILEFGNLDAEQREHVAVILDSGKHLLGLIDGILDLARLEAGRMSIDPQAMKLGPQLSGVVEMVRPMAVAKGLRLHLETVGALPACVSCDSGRLRQILLNLLGNAVKFTAAGEIVLRCSWADGMLRLAVADTGMGIDPEALAGLFQPFIQAEAGINRRFGGSGLGLVISRRLARLMGGDITVESLPGQGSTFIVILAAPASAEPQAHPAERPRLSGRVLVVEDNRSNQMVASALLKGLGLQVELASDGKIALARLRDPGIDLVLMDCQMPVLDGYAATRLLRETGNRLPVIALTASALTGDREACLAAGMDDYLTKPLRREDLVHLLQRYLGAQPPSAGTGALRL